jgi:rubrerythrin
MTHEITTMIDFLARALAIEREAAARYLQFADQMLVHENPRVAAAFEQLARRESEHHAQLQARARAHSFSLGDMKPWEYRWIDPESAQAAPLGEVHYLMSPWHALGIALENEERARRFFESVAAHEGCPAEVRSLARELASGEAQYAAALAELRSHTPRPGPRLAD